MPESSFSLLSWSIHLLSCTDALPLNFKLFQPAGTEWCIEEKKFQIKAKLQLVFPSAEACFCALDTDGRGSLDRSEISRGLRDNGIWLFSRRAHCVFWIGLTKTAGVKWN
jgi:hypothetical protein